MKRNFILFVAFLGAAVGFFACSKSSNTDAPKILVALTPATSEISSETGSSATIDVTSNVALPADATAIVEVIPGTTPLEDFTTSPDAQNGKITLNLPKGSTKASITITAVKKTATTDRTVVFRLLSVTGAQLGASVSHTVTIKKSGSAPSGFKTVAQIAALPRGTALTPGEKMAGIIILAKDNITGRNIVLQNGNAGIIVRFDVNNTYDKGDSIQITFAAGDSTGLFNDVKQVYAKLANVTKISSGNVVTPRTITIAQLNSRNYENTLVRIENATFDPGQGTLSGNKIFKVGNESSRLFTSSSASFANELVPSGKGTIVGVAGYFPSAAQISLRSKDDLIGFTATNPTEVTLNGFGDVKKYDRSAKITAGIKLTGIVTLSKSNINVSNIYIQDATGGTQVRFLVSMSGTTGVSSVPYEIGDELEITTDDSTYIDEFRGQKQIYFKLSNVMKKSSGKSVTPRTVTIDEFNARTYEGELLKIENIIFDDANGTNKYYGGSGSGTNRKFSSASDRTKKGELRTTSNATFKDEILPSGTHDLIGVAGSFDGTAQLFMRTKADAIKK